MAISKEILNNKKKKTNQPEPLGTVPANNPEHVSAPVGFHHPIPPKPVLYNSFEEAKAACELVFLKPGEAHTEFYQKDGIYHCVVAIGNIDTNTEHLYLTDSGNEMSIDDRLNNISEQMVELSKSFSKLNEKFDDLTSRVDEFESNVNESLNQIRQDILNLENLINEFNPIDNASINSLFRNDVYTVNLCCYSAGGYVKIFDNCGGTGVGGTNTRVAEYTPFNEYKTYIEGDDVSFMAVANEGYKFVNWYLNNEPISDSSTVSANFTDSDINVIGTLNNNIEPAILLNGYTAVFKPLHQLYLNIHCSVNNQSLEQKFFNDNVIVRINGEEQDITKPIYYDNNATIELIAQPDASGNHDFINYNITENHTTIIVESESYAKHHVYNDLTVNANFKEYWIEVTADAYEHNYGKITIDPLTARTQWSADGKHLYYLGGDQIKLIAIKNSGYLFNKWTISNGHPTEQQLANDIEPYNLTDNQIILNINKIVNEYELVAMFVDDTRKFRVYYNGNGASGEVKDDNEYSFDDEVTVLPNGFDPYEGYIFNNWNTQSDGSGISYNAGNIFNIQNDTILYAQWNIATYNVDFYVNDSEYHNVENVAYGTLLGAVKPSDPTDIEGYVFQNWMVNGIDVDDTYEIKNYTRFDASLLPEQIYVTFNAEDGEFSDESKIKQVIVNYNSTLGDIEIENPIYDGYNFVAWQVNSEDVDDNYTITESTTFTARYEETPVEDTYDFVNVGYITRDQEYPNANDIKDIMNENYIWVDNVIENAKVFGRTYSISGTIYNSLGLASNTSSGKISFTVGGEDIKILLGTSGNAGTKNTATVYVNGEYRYYDNIQVLYDYDLVNNDIIPEPILTNNIINASAGSSIQINTDAKKQINIVGIYKKHVMSNMLFSNVINFGNNIKKYTVCYYDLNNGNDMIILVDNGETINAPQDIIQKAEYEFKGWKCITDPTFEFGVTPVTQNLEFEPIWEPI